MRRRTAWLAWCIVGLSLVVAVLTLVLHHANRQLPAGWWSSYGLFGPIVVVLLGGAGALIVARQPANPIGWMCCAGGLSWGGGALAWEYGSYGVATRPGSLPGAVFALWVGPTFWAQPAAGLIPFLLLLFPTGSLPSKRWRPVGWIAGVASAVMLVSMATLQGPLFGAPYAPSNPIGVLSEATIEILYPLTAGLLFLAGLASVVAVVVRFRAAQGQERQQLKWFLYGAVWWVPVIIMPLPDQDNIALGTAIAVAGLGVFTGCVAVAMLRYRLYDIDRLITRTLVYALLTGVLGIAYAGVVVGLGQLLGQNRSGLAVAGATLTVAALFQPARRRIQAAVDRRFNRRRYDATQTITVFSARLREEVDLDTLTAELLAVVEQTMQPTQVWLWLKVQPPSGTAGAGMAGQRTLGNERL